MAKAPTPASVRNLLETLDDALELLGEYPASNELVSSSDTPASLLEQCLDLCADRGAGGPEPVRTLHHFACSGGSLISKCVAAMPNTQLLSEVDPLSRLLEIPGRARFAPSDLPQLMRQSSRGVRDELLVEMFVDSLDLIRAETLRLGQHLVLRDHAHGHYCHGPGIPFRPSLREIVMQRFPVQSVVTVRHPLDSYLALLSNGWISYLPTGLDEYSRRYLVFLQAHAGVPLMRYEDFLDDPESGMQALCRYLDLPYNPQFTDIFDAIPVTGDSGRSGSVIERRPRRATGDDILAEAARAPHYGRLLRQLGYGE